MEKASIKSILMVAFLLLAIGFQVAASRIVPGICENNGDCGSAAQSVCKSLDDCIRLAPDPLCKASECMAGTCIFVCLHFSKVAPNDWEHLRCKTSADCISYCRHFEPLCSSHSFCTCYPNSLPISLVGNTICNTKQDCLKLIDDAKCSANCIDGTCIFFCE